MAVTVIVELQARPGRRSQLEAVLERVVADQGPSQPGFLGSGRYEALEDPDTLIEIADWESAESRETQMAESATTGVNAPVLELLAAPIRATVVRRLP